MGKYTDYDLLQLECLGILVALITDRLEVRTLHCARNNPGSNRIRLCTEMTATFDLSETGHAQNNLQYFLPRGSKF